ncbi:MAG: phosphoribosylformylglycinamidine synthase I [Planctomycetes bacterium]|nr:phosphoribosylformylglycinamidine synthase I [Planctomycetota bacterium]
MKPRFLVLRAAGTNCDLETAFALESCGARAERVHVNRLLGGQAALDACDALVIPGGFSYGDDIAAGKVLAVELLHHLRDPILALVERGGLVLGICNGFQVLVKMGMLPGIAAPIGVQEAALTDNDSSRYEDRRVRLVSVAERCVFCGPGERIELPLAHAEGKYVPRDAALHRAVVAGGHVALRYVAADGGAPSYPENPNGSIDHVAGLVDRTGRVLGLMPHPERALLRVHHPAWTRETPPGAGEDGHGARFFRNAVLYLRG